MPRSRRSSAPESAGEPRQAAVGREQIAGHARARSRRGEPGAEKQREKLLVRERRRPEPREALAGTVVVGNVADADRESRGEFGHGVFSTEDRRIADATR